MVDPIVHMALDQFQDMIKMQEDVHLWEILLVDALHHRGRPLRLIHNYVSVDDNEYTRYFPHSHSMHDSKRRCYKKMMRRYKFEYKKQTKKHWIPFI